MRGGANGGSIFDYQQELGNVECIGIARDPGWRPLRHDEASLPNRELGKVDYSLDFYGEKAPYYWRHD